MRRKSEYGPITKQGRSEIQAVWMQTAHKLLVVKDPITQPLQYWWQQVATYQRKKTACVALA